VIAYVVSRSFARRRVRSAVSITELQVLALALLVVGLGVIAIEPAAAAIAIAIALPFVAPSWTIGAVLVPSGLTRLTWHFARRARHTRMAGLAAARALMRRPRESSAQWLETRLDRELELGTMGAVAAACVALVRGNRELARDTCDAVLEVEGADKRGARLAREIVALDAAARGDWSRIVALDATGPRSRLLDLLIAATQHRLDPEHGPSRARVWRTWLRAPRRRATWPIVRCLTARAGDEPSPVVPACDLTAHAALLARPAGSVRIADLQAAVTSIDAIRGSTEVLSAIARRSRALASARGPGDRTAPPIGAAAGVAQVPTGDVAVVRDRIVRDAEDDLVRVMREQRLPIRWLPDGVTGDAIRARVREVRRRDVEVLAGELARRADERVDLPEVEEWRAWSEVRRACATAWLDATEPGERSLLFHVVYGPLTTYAVRLCNVRTRRSLAGAVTRYVRDLGRAAGAVDAYGHLDRNVAGVAASHLPAQHPLEGEHLHDAGATERLRHRKGLVLGFALALGVVCLTVSSFAAQDIRASTPALAAGPATLVVLTLAAWLYRARRRILEAAAWTPDGLVVQVRRGRHHVERGDVRSLATTGTARVVVGLWRAPEWLPHRLVLVAGSVERARAVAARIQTLAVPSRPR
jgi:hypothetical protein